MKKFLFLLMSLSTTLLATPEIDEPSYKKISPFGETRLRFEHRNWEQTLNVQIGDGSTTSLRGPKPITVIAFPEKDGKIELVLKRENITKTVKVGLIPIDVYFDQGRDAVKIKISRITTVYINDKKINVIKSDIMLPEPKPVKPATLFIKEANTEIVPVKAE